MSVTLTAIQLAAAMRIGDGVAALEEPQASVLNRILASAIALVESYAPNAPESIQNESVIRVGGYLYDSPPGASMRFANPLADSGAQALLARFRIVRATAIETDLEQVARTEAR